MRNSEKVRRSTAPNLLVQYLLAELTLQLTVDPSKSQRLFPRADGRSQQEPTARADGRSQQKPTVDPSKNRQQEPTVVPNNKYIAKSSTDQVHFGYLVHRFIENQQS
jgi:hypothetical protein